MKAPLVHPDLLEKSTKILFIAHLALGDFTYLQNCLEAFSRAYPDVKIHLWVDERRRTRRASEWEHLKKYALYDWLAECSYIDKVYDQTYSPGLLKTSISAAQQQNYPIVVSLGVLERHKYALLAREISPQGFVVVQKNRVRPYDLYKRYVYTRVDAFIPAYSKATHPDQHISDIYAEWFLQIFGLHISPKERFPFVHIPEKWLCHAHVQFKSWGFCEDSDSGCKRTRVVFLNSFSKSLERNWPLERLIELVQLMRRLPAWANTGFIVNVVPEELERARNVFSAYNLEQVHLFSAEENFFQLPAVLSLCDLIISVETAVMHLANAVHVPVIALMRQKNPEWAPIDTANSIVITVPQSDDWVEKITIDDVLMALPAL